MFRTRLTFFRKESLRSTVYKERERFESNEGEFLSFFSGIFFDTLLGMAPDWGKNAIMTEFTRRHILKEINVINYIYKDN